MRFADVAARMPRSGIREIMDLSAKLASACIHLEVGQPDFPAPPHVISATQEQVPTHTHYIPNAGLTELRQAVARYTTRRTGVQTLADNILITQV